VYLREVVCKAVNILHAKRRGKQIVYEKLIERTSLSALRRLLSLTVAVELVIRVGASMDVGSLQTRSTSGAHDQVNRGLARVH